MANTFQEVFIDCKRNIQIPLLQRDYVQGGRESVIVPFLEQLVSAILNEDSTVNLNYIYGYEGEDGFIPIDGQQRLITLWLLHLYIYSQRSLVFPVDLKFESREFADAFSKKLKERLPDFLKLNEVKLKDCIVDSPWFVAGWLYDATVVNMLETLNRIHVVLGGTVPTDINTQNISFDFLNMKDVGLDDDVYVKMNGRGRPLSYFENLKSWMDEQVKTLFGEDNQFSRDWRTKMDNDWTELFWNNRNKQEHPEEIDDEQLRFFYSMLLLYWKQNDSGFCSNESDETKRKVIKSLQECKELISLYQINKFALFNREVFRFISESLEVLREISLYVNKLDNRITKILGFDSSGTTLLYKIALKEATYEKTLPLLYAITKTPVVYRNEDAFFRWMRLWSNLIINSDIRNDDIKKACATIDFVSESIVGDNLYNVISALIWKNGIGFDKEQFNEERAKAKQIIDGGARTDGESWEETIINAESHAFFKGAIRFLFTGADNNEDWDSFVPKAENIKKLIPEKKEERHTIKLLTPYISKQALCEIYFDKWVSNNDEDLRSILLYNKAVPFLHDFLLQNKITETISDLHQDIMDLCEMAYGGRGYLQTGWGDESKYIWTEYVRRQGYYSWYSYVVGSESFMRLSEIIDKSESFTILEDQRNRRIGKHIQGLYIHFKFKYQDHFFTLFGNNTICLMANNWEEKVPNPEDPNGFYFSIQDIKTEEQLINQVKEMLVYYKKKSDSLTQF